MAKLDEDTRARLARWYDHALKVLDVDPAVIAALHSECGFDGRSAVAAALPSEVR